MYLAYMDEAGNTGTCADPNQPVHMLGCLLVEDAAVRAMEDAIADVGKRHFPQLSLQPGFEFHGAHLYSGKAIFRGVSPDARIKAMRDLVEVTTEHAAAFGYTGVNKVKTFANDHPHRIAFTLMVERVEPWLRTRDSLGLIVADENNEPMNRFWLVVLFGIWELMLSKTTRGIEQIATYAMLTPAEAIGITAMGIITVLMHSVTAEVYAFRFRGRIAAALAASWVLHVGFNEAVTFLVTSLGATIFTGLLLLLPLALLFFVLWPKRSAVAVQ